MQFEAPFCLLFVLLAIVPWLRIKGQTPAQGRTRDPRHSALRSGAIVLVALALARPVQVTESGAGQPPQAIVWDRSPSVSASADSATSQAIDELLASRDDSSWVVHEISGPNRAPWTPPAGVSLARVADGGASGTALDAAIQAALRSSSKGGQAQRVTVFSDGLGRHSRSSARELREALGASGATLDFRRQAGVADDLRLTGLGARGELRVGTSGEILATLEGAGQRVDLRLTAHGVELAQARGVRVEGATSVALAVEPEEAGFLDLTLEAVVVEGVDPRAGDLLLSATVGVEAPAKLLYFGDRMEGGSGALANLIGAGFEVIEADGLGAVGASDLSSADLGLDACDVIVIDDCPAARIPAPLQRAIQSAVQDSGVGLVMTGGEAAFGPGGYHDQPLESVLPVEFVQKEEKRDPSTTLVVIIDTSGSMGGNRVQLAKEVSRLAIRRLLPHDKVGLVEFYGAKRWAVPIQPASNSIEIERALNRLDAGGGTVILPAIEEAYYGLKNVSTRYKHVLILTDGGVETGSFEPLLRRMADDGMTVSTVLVGPDAHSEFLVNIANWGQGRFYSVPNRFNLPEILLKQPASAKLPAYRPGGVTVEPTAFGPAWWGKVDATMSIPQLSGYVETRLRPGAESVLETADEGHPIVASWRHGLGRVTAMTTEPTGPGTDSWRSWSGFAGLMTRMIERTAADSGAPFAYALRREGGEAVLVAERRALAASAGANGEQPLVPSAQVMNPGRLDSSPVTFRQTAPDRYEARFPFHDPDATLRIAAGAISPSPDRAGARTRQRSATFLTLDPGPGELQVPSSRAAVLERLAAASSASVAPLSPAVRLRELAPLFAVLALLVYLADVLYRRWPTRTLK